MSKAGLTMLFGVFDATASSGLSVKTQPFEAIVCNQHSIPYRSLLNKKTNKSDHDDRFSYY
jgi:hypothetical protein